MTVAPTPVPPELRDRSRDSDMHKRPWGSINGTPVYLVSGAWIRDRLDDDFTDYGQHLHKPYVPAGEIWVDQATDPSEVRYMAHACFVEAREMATGATFDAAHDVVDAENAIERQSDAVRFNPLIEGRLADVGQLRVVVVNGQVVRDLFSPDWVYGGHHYVYPWIPEGEIWIEDALEDTDKFFVLLHEARERKLMSVDGWPYERAHADATSLEQEARDNPERLRELLAEQEDQPVTKALVTEVQIADWLRKHAPEIAGLIAKEQPTAGDVHATTALGNERRGKRKRKPAISMVGEGQPRVNPARIALSEACPYCDAEFDDEHDEGCPMANGGAVEWSADIAVSKVDADKQQIFGWASVTHIDGEPVVDKQDDVIETEELEKAAYDFVLYSRQQGHMHERVGVGKCIESCVFTKEKSDVGLRGFDAETGEQLFGWWVGFRVDDPEVWKQHKAGELPELSIGGRAKRFEI